MNNKPGGVKGEAKPIFTAEQLNELQRDRIRTLRMYVTFYSIMAVSGWGVIIALAIHYSINN